MRIGDCVNAFLEVCKSGINLTFFIIDFVYFIGSYILHYTLDSRAALFILGLGLALSAINLIKQKNGMLAVALLPKLPCIVLHFRRDINGNKGKILRIRNSSGQPIKNIYFSEIDMKVFKLSLRLEGTNVLESEEERNLELYQVETGNPCEFLAALDPEYATVDFVVEITYQDYKDNKYVTTYILGKSGLTEKTVRRL